MHGETLKSQTYLYL